MEAEVRNPTQAQGCAHCGLPVPPALAHEQGPSFCCHGCETVYEVIHAAGFDAYYAMRDEESGQAVESTDRSFEELDDPAFVERESQALEGGLRQVELFLEGVHCSACMWLIEKALAREEGVGESRLEFGRARLSLVWNPEQVRLSRIARRLAQLGYVPHPTRRRARGQRNETRQLLVRIGLSGAVAGNVMLMAFALYGGWASGMAENHRQLFRVLSCLATLPSVTYAAWPFYRSAWMGLRSRVLHMDLPISIGIWAGFAGGLVNTLRGHGEIYFDSVTTLIFLLLVGRLLQTRQQRRATESSELLYALTPSAATRFEPDGKKRVPLEALAPGDRIAVDPGEIVPTDGFVQSGCSALDMSLLSGESVPVSVGPDDRVWGGTVNLDAALVLVVSAELRSSRVGKIADMVETAASGKAPVVQLADRVAGGFVAIVLGLALITFAAWSVLAPGEAIDRAVALLIVSCPCALGLATPLAITAAIGKAARRGVLVRSGSALEALGRMGRGTVFFDKTGTLTYGRMDLVRFDGPDWVKPLVAAAEASSQHPVGAALRRAFDPQGLVCAQVEAIHGGGVAATVGEHEVRIGSPKWVGASALRDADFDVRAQACWDAALTPVWVAVDGRVQAVCGLADTVREDARDSLEDLRELGFDIAILSGDHPAVVERVGAQLGLPAERCHGGLSPEDKLHLVTEAAERSPVVMVGDGVNDAAALARATVGIAVHGGAETAFEAADVFLQKAGVTPLVDLVLGARRTYRSIRDNVVFSLAYNSVGASLAMGGLLNPLVAAVLMPISSLVVVTNSFRFPFGRRS